MCIWSLPWSRTLTTPQISWDDAPGFYKACSLPLQTALAAELLPPLSMLLSLWLPLHPSKMPAPPWLHVSARPISSARSGLQLPPGLVTLVILGLSVNVTSSGRASFTLWTSPCHPFYAPIVHCSFPSWHFSKPWSSYLYNWLLSIYLPY